MPLRIAIDGPAGVGKSTLAARLATAFGLPKLDTGAIYRTLALAAERAGVSWDDGPALAELAAHLPIRFAGGTGRAGTTVLLGNEDVSAAIRTPEMSRGSSLVSRHAPVRAALLPLQRALAAGGAVAEGRDIGTVVLPDAEVKIFLVASPRERARRRRLELREKGLERALEDVLAEQDARDERDSTREASPLRAAADAITIDTDGLTLEEVVQRVLALVAERTGLRPR
ncbi:MAG: (d)CMP kinase [Deltaproteobacteria bacterium]|nr:(d)CMP kinase [Deltaproteobacteria bacterium]